MDISNYFNNVKSFIINCEASRPKSTSHAYAILASFFLSLELFILKFISSNQNSFHFALVRSTFALLANSWAIEVFKTPIFKDIRGKFFGNLCTRGFLGFVVIVGMYATFSFISLSEGMVLILMTPIWTFILGKLIMGQNFKAKNIPLCLLSLVGVYLVFNSNISQANSGKNQLIGACLALGIGIIRAFANILVKSLTNKVALLSINQFHYIVTILCCSILLIFINNLNDFTLLEYICVAFAGFIGFIAQNIGVRAIFLENPGIIQSLQYSSIIFSLFFDFLILGAEIHLLSVIGCLLIVASTILIILTENL